MLSFKVGTDGTKVFKVCKPCYNIKDLNAYSARIMAQYEQLGKGQRTNVLLTRWTKTISCMSLDCGRKRMQTLGEHAILAYCFTRE